MVGGERREVSSLESIEKGGATFDPRTEKEGNRGRSPCNQYKRDSPHLGVGGGVK